MQLLERHSSLGLVRPEVVRVCLLLRFILPHIYGGLREHCGGGLRRRRRRRVAPLVPRTGAPPQRERDNASGGQSYGASLRPQR